MEPWILGLVAVMVVGVAVILFGALWDRARTRRAAAEMLAPPQRHIPQFQPGTTAPAYLSELQAHRPPEGAAATDLTSAERDLVRRQVKDGSTTTIAGGYAAPGFVTDPPSGLAVLDGPVVLVCTDPVESIRELVALLERCVLSSTPLVVAAPSLSPEVTATLEVNRIRRSLRVLAVEMPGPAELDLVASLTGAVPRSCSDLQAGYVWPEHLGRCGRWVSSAKRSHLIDPSPGSPPRSADRAAGPADGNQHPGGV